MKVRTILGIFMFLIICIGGTAWWYWQDMQHHMLTPLNIDTAVNYTIKPGMSLQAVSEELSSMGMLTKPYYLIFEAQRKDRTRQIKAGEYYILPGTTPLQLLDQFIAGKVVQHSLVLLEGWSFTQLMMAVQNSEHLIQTIENMTGEQILTVLDCPWTHPEGIFFPDTYHFPTGTTDLDFLQRACDMLQQVLIEEWQQRVEGLPYQSPYEALIMASIIEKETGLSEERGKIAGIFVRRLQRGMKLQTDPTIIYAMRETFDGDIRRKDLDVDSPYNTYLYKGLPPTPIALAGTEAIHAALHPEDGSSLYFVAKGDGSHYFSDTLKEHNKAVAKYQLGKRE
ncbi:MAG: endolytic transglycosylase MltG [Gammaproteobacteria bacterium]